MRLLAALCTLLISGCASRISLEASPQYSASIRSATCESGEPAVSLWSVKFLALRRESAVRREFGQSNLLDAIVLLYPLGPIALLVGPRFLPQVPLFACVAGLFSAALLVAAKQRNALECSGTNRVKAALAATSTASLGAIVGIIYVGLAGTFAFIAHAIQSRPLGV